MKRCCLAFSLLAVLATSSPARADFTITINDVESGFNQMFTDDDGFFDTNSAVGEITFDATNLNTALAAAGSKFRFSGGFGGDSNATGANITSAVLSLSGTVTRIASGFGTITVTLLEDAFNLTPNGVGTMTSAASQTYGKNGPAGQRTFESIFDGSVSTPVLTFGLTAAPPNNNSSGGNSVGVNILGQFSLSNVSGFTLDGNEAFINFTGTTEVTAVPEPASMAMLMLGGSALALRLRRRKLS